MTALDTSLPPTIAAVISRLGKAATIKTASGVSYSRSTGVGSQTPVPHSVKVTPPSQVRRGLIELGLATAADAQCTVAADGLGFTPAAGDTLTFTLENEQWSILRVEPIYVGENVGAYRLILRRGT